MYFRGKKRGTIAFCWFRVFRSMYVLDVAGRDAGGCCGAAEARQQHPMQWNASSATCCHRQPVAANKWPKLFNY